MCDLLGAFGDPQSPSSDCSVTAWHPSSSQGRDEGCIDGELDATPRRQAVGNDLNVPFVLPGRGNIEVSQQNMGCNRQTRAAARSRGPLTRLSVGKLQGGHRMHGRSICGYWPGVRQASNGRVPRVPWPRRAGARRRVRLPSRPPGHPTSETKHR